MATKVLQDTIKELLAKCGRKHKDLCDAIGISDSGVRKIYARNSCEISTLRKMAEFFDVPITDFFDREEIGITIKNNENSFNPGQNESETIQELTNIINEQRKRIDYLTDQLLKK